MDTDWIWVTWTVNLGSGTGKILKFRHMETYRLQVQKCCSVLPISLTCGATSRQLTVLSQAHVFPLQRRMYSRKTIYEEGKKRSGVFVTRIVETEESGEKWWKLSSVLFRWGGYQTYCSAVHKEVNGKLNFWRTPHNKAYITQHNVY